MALELSHLVPGPHLHQQKGGLKEKGEILRERIGTKSLCTRCDRVPGKKSEAGFHTHTHTHTHNHNKNEDETVYRMM